MDILKIYPSGRCTASRRKKFNLEAVSRPYELTEQQEWDTKMMHLHGLESTIAAKNSTNAPIPLGLSSVPNLSIDAENRTLPLKSPRGSGGITSKSRQQVKDGATLLEKKYGRNQLSFITHTIPTPFIVDIHANWAKILANLRKRYIRMLKRAGLPEDLIMVSEYQEERLAQTGKAVLHLHIVLVGRFKKRHWAYTKEHYKTQWRECCEQYIRERTIDRDWIAASRIESIKKSCASYLGKYMSKGVAAIASVLLADSNAFIPSSWHILSQEMRVWIRKAVKHYEGKTASDLFDWLSSNAIELLKFNRYVKIPTVDGRGLTVGWYGDLKNRDLFN